ncbi:unnamed protein product [Oncorhynchus mykiss]|uniref:FERM domain-containing protein n=1 Tax=Oncorhynchus mykiss TaxID=8022 RepID=A0A060YMR6_ONCMY|nr:unnamed protein product [Oncorhynchus mykiss]
MFLCDTSLLARYQYYLQVKKEVLDGRLHCTVEQGIRLAGLAVQADFGDFTQFLSQDFLREYVLFPVVSQLSHYTSQCVCACACACMRVIFCVFQCSGVCALSRFSQVCV